MSATVTCPSWCDRHEYDARGDLEAHVSRTILDQPSGTSRSSSSHVYLAHDVDVDVPTAVLSVPACVESPAELRVIAAALLEAAELLEQDGLAQK